MVTITDEDSAMLTLENVTIATVCDIEQEILELSETSLIVDGMSGSLLIRGPMPIVPHNVLYPLKLHNLVH